MSVQFGRWNFNGQSAAEDYIERIGAAIAPYGPDGNERYSKDGVTILYRAFCTTTESFSERHPQPSACGAMITWDGVLDNRKELIRALEGSVGAASSDAAIVAAAYDKWREKSLARLIGDWALSIWNPKDQSLLLARDPLGTHFLYYTFDEDHVAWCTILEPLVQHGGKTFEICSEYIAGWFVVPAFPAAHLTPYVGVHAVPPSSSVLLQQGRHGARHVVGKYWDFDPGKKIRYRTDGEYEEHYRAAFAQAVQRKLRSKGPILAELSGGMDSSSIVCVADDLIAKGQAECPRLDTISWYDDTYDHLQPDNNEFHWLRRVEERRGRAGHHINFRELNAIEPKHPPIPFAGQFDDNIFAATPVPNNSSSRGEFFKRCKAISESNGYRVALSGIGGDEPTGGGVPTPTPELQNLLSRGRFLTLVRQLNAWAKRMRTSPLSLLWEAMKGFFSVPMEPVSADTLKTPWLTSDFLHRNRAAICGYPSRIRFLGPLPSFQAQIDQLECTRRFFEFRGGPSPEVLEEVRYPFCDRDFREFMYAIPREQVVGVGKRRHLMKRAMSGVVPDEILNRRRKLFTPPAPEPASQPNKPSAEEWPTTEEIGRHILSSACGIVDPARFLEALEKARRGEAVPSHSLRRSLTLEAWLRHLDARGVLSSPPPASSTQNAPVSKPTRVDRQSEEPALARSAH